MAARQNSEDLGAVVDWVKTVDDQVSRNLAFVLVLAIWNALLSLAVLVVVLA